MLNVTVTNRKTNDKRSYKFSQNTILIGRQQNCDVMLESEAVSRKHAKLSLNKSSLHIEDLGSGNGTLVNQVRLQSNEKQPLSFGDTVRIEEFELKCVLDTATKSDGESISRPEQTNTNTKTSQPPSIQKPQRNVDATDADILEIKMIKKVLGALDHEKMPSLTVISDEFKNRSIHFEDGTDEIVIGRDADCQFCLNSNVISRRHAVIAVKWGGYVITDLNSKNHTYVNGEQIKEKSIKDGDEIILGTIRTVFKNPQQFDFSTIGQSLFEEKNKAKKFEETSSFQSTDIKDEPQKISATAQLSTDSDKDLIKPDPIEPAKKTEAPQESKDNPKENTTETKDKDSKDKKETSSEALDDLMDDDNKDDQSKNKSKKEATSKTENTKTKKATNQKAKFTGMELLLFGFGTLVIFAVLGVLAMLFLV